MLRRIEVVITLVQFAHVDMLGTLDRVLRAFVRIPYVNQRPAIFGAFQAALDFLGSDHRDSPHRLALRSGRNDAGIAALDVVERDAHEMRHGCFELVFIGSDESDTLAFADEPTGECGDHANRQVHGTGQMP